MKKLLSTVAAMAMLSASGVAHADNVGFSGTTPLGTTGNPLVFAGAALLSGTGYSQFGLNAGNSETASPTVTNTWTIKGAVDKDCSYYGGNTTSHTIDFGHIGVNTQAATSLSNAFTMVSPAVANVNSLTAGCNFKNTVTITKTNGADGLKNGDAAAAGYDTNNFQANIPYRVDATFTAGSAGTVGAAPVQTLTANLGDGSKVGNYGAWRSIMNMVVTAPAPNKALVAGNYQDTLTVELKAL